MEEKLDNNINESKPKEKSKKEIIGQERKKLFRQEKQIMSKLNLKKKI